MPDMQHDSDPLYHGASTQQAWGQWRDAREAWLNAVDALRDFERTLRDPVMTDEALEAGMLLRIQRNEAAARLGEIDPPYALVRDGHFRQP